MERRLVGDYEKFHAAGSYGETGWKSLPDILPHLIALKPRSLIDYGCGQSDLADIVSAKCGVELVGRFDPAIPMYAEKPEQTFDVLISVDVLEHVPDAEIDTVVKEMASFARDALIIIDTGPAKKFLSDGSNAHVSQHSSEWWLERMKPSMPGLTAIHVRRRRRVGFKTWSAELPGALATWVRWREAMAVQSRKIAGSLGRSSAGS